MSSGNMLEMAVLESHPRFIESEALGICAFENEFDAH